MMKNNDLSTEGLFAYRLDPAQNNPREVAFHDEWAHENNTSERRCLLGALIPDFSKRDAVIAATIVQWLGSNVGFSFVEESFKRCGYRIKKDETMPLKGKRGVKQIERQSPAARSSIKEK